MAKCTKTAGFTDEEKRVRKHMIDQSITQAQIARALNLHRQDVSNVVCGISRSPRYIKMVYEFIGLDVPKGCGQGKRTRIKKKALEENPPADIAS